MSKASLTADVPWESSPFGILLSGQDPLSMIIFSFSYLKILCIFINLEMNLTLFLTISISDQQENTGGVIWLFFGVFNFEFLEKFDVFFGYIVLIAHTFAFRVDDVVEDFRYLFRDERNGPGENIHEIGQ